MKRKIICILMFFSCLHASQKEVNFYVEDIKDVGRFSENQYEEAENQLSKIIKNHFTTINEKRVKEFKTLMKEGKELSQKSIVFANIERMDNFANEDQLKTYFNKEKALLIAFSNEKRTQKNANITTIILQKPERTLKYPEDLNEKIKALLEQPPLEQKEEKNVAALAGQLTDLHASLLSLAQNIQ